MQNLDICRLTTVMSCHDIWLLPGFVFKKLVIQGSKSIYVTVHEKRDLVTQNKKI